MPVEPAVLHLDDPEAGPLSFDAFVAGPSDADRVLLLHGWPQTARSFDLVAARLAAAGLRCAAVDQRGFSPGARPVGVEHYRVDRLVADATGFLDALGWERAHLVGHDWGAAVGWALAARHPGRLRSFTALSVPHGRSLTAAIRTDPDQQRRSAYIGVFRGPEGVAEEALMADGAAKFRALFGDDVPAGRVHEYLRAMSQPGALTASLSWYRAMGAEQFAVPDVEVPTTYVWGEDDVAVGVAAAAGCAACVRADYRFVRLPGRGHWLPEQAPDEVAAAVLDRVRAAG